MLTQQEANDLKEYSDSLDKANASLQAMLAKARNGEPTSPTALANVALTAIVAAGQLGIRLTKEAAD